MKEFNNNEEKVNYVERYPILFSLIAFFSQVIALISFPFLWTYFKLTGKEF